MPTMKRIIALATLAVVSLLTACASTKVETSGSLLKEPVCRIGARPLTTVVYWGPQWRADQKEPPLRESVALRGIQDFLSHTSCLAVSGVHRLPSEDVLRSDEELMRMASSLPTKPERVLFIVVRELGPRLTVGIPIIVEGGTEVLIDVRVLDPQSSAPLANSRTFWRNGGTFVIKGVKTLDQDMSAALSATLMPSPGPK